MLKKPDIITYCASQTEADLAINAGADHLILDHPSISLCSFIPPKPSDTIKSLNTLITYCKNTYPHITLSINCDILTHQNHLPLINQLSALIQSNPVNFVRVQDVGLLYHFSKQCPTIYHAQMGNSSYLSVAEISNHAARQTLSMDLPHTDISLIQTKTNTPLEIVVHGHCLIQYSQRRFLSSLTNDSPNHLKQIHLLAEDEDYPGRRFTFLDNPHGHFMFAYFDRSLLNDTDELKDCNLSGWIIDTRGQDKQYWQSCITAYQNLCDPNPNLELAEKLFATIKDIAPRPLKPGFFRMNQTDKRRFKKVAHQAQDSQHVIGQVLDVVAKKRITILLKQTIKLGERFEVLHPKVESLTVEASMLWDVDNKLVKSAGVGELVQLPWVKGIQQHSLLLRTSEK